MNTADLVSIFARHKFFLHLLQAYAVRSIIKNCPDEFRRYMKKSITSMAVHGDFF